MLLYVDIETLNTVVNFDTNWIVTTQEANKMLLSFRVYVFLSISKVTCETKRDFDELATKVCDV